MKNEDLINLKVFNNSRNPNDMQYHSDDQYIYEV